MINIATVRKALPPFSNKRQLIKLDQGTDDIIKEILKTHGLFADQYDLIAELFDTGDIYTTCRDLWDFCKYNLPYNIEAGSEQSVKSPSAILHPGEKVDCKHYSLFIGGVLDAIRREYDEDWTWCYRFAAYDGSKEVGHVFVVVFDGNSEIWIDPVLSSFNYKKEPTFYIDKKAMLSLISGVPDNDNAGVTIQANTAKAVSSFLYMLNSDCFSLKELFKNNPGVVNGAFKVYCEKNDIDFRIVQNILSE